MSDHDQNYNDNVTAFRRPEKANSNGSGNGSEPPFKRPAEPVFNLPPVTNLFIMVILGVHLIRFLLPQDLDNSLLLHMAFIPARYSSYELFWSWPAFLSPVTHMLLHSGWTHLLLNVAMLMAFGAGVERFVGGRKMALLALLTGIVGILGHFAFNMGSPYPVIGASGAISGLFACALIVMQHTGRLPPGRRTLIIITAIWFGVSIVFDLIGTPGADGPVAWAAHMAGFIAGFALFKPVCRLKI